MNEPETTTKPDNREAPEIDSERRSLADCPLLLPFSVFRCSLELFCHVIGPLILLSSLSGTFKDGVSITGATEDDLNVNISMWFVCY